MAAIDDKFIAVVKAMETKTRGVHAFAVINPGSPTAWGRIVIKYPKDGASRLQAIAWLPSVGSETYRHHGSATGGGYDKATAAMGGAKFYNLKTFSICELVDQGANFRRQLEDAGYLVNSGSMTR